jgi:hypothetical protein
MVEPIRSRGSGLRLPSAPDVTEANALEVINICHQYMALKRWDYFQSQYRRLAAYHAEWARSHAVEDELEQGWNGLRASAVDSILRNIEGARTYDDFLHWTERLAEIVTDRRCLWNLLHTEVHPSLKVTLDQSHEIASHFFSPTLIFEFGLESFFHCSLCHLQELKTEEELIDAFYALAGYIRACRLDKDYQVTAISFLDFVTRLLISYTTIPKFDGKRFVWLLEAVGQHLMIPPRSFRRVCEAVLGSFCERDAMDDPLSYLCRMCQISTSPSLQSFPGVLQETVSRVFGRVVAEQHELMRRYLFGCYVTCSWDGASPPELSIPLRGWRLYVQNLVRKTQRMAELPRTLFIDVITNSLNFFVGYYGEVQAKREKAASLRRDIFEGVAVCVTYWPGPVDPEALESIWFLLSICAISGAPDELVAGEIDAVDCPENDQPYLGLAHNETDFEDYHLALSRLVMKFENERDTVPTMIKFLRQNY